MNSLNIFIQNSKVIEMSPIPGQALFLLSAKKSSRELTRY